MTEKQRKLVIDNHNLIYSFLYTYGYDIEDFYDLAAIGLCKAAEKWDESRGLFSKFAYICMKSEIGHHFTMQNYHKRIPKDKILYYHAKIPHSSHRIEDKDNEFICLLDGYDSFEDEILFDICVETIKKHMNNREKMVFELVLEGYNDSEIGKFIGFSRTTVANTKKKLRELLIDILEDLK